ncbi:tryptophan-rich sensory protein [Staphylococcus sp. SQ8-PEA]|uniref:Tryptophan-rich sensory protein n=1 Tax=Staphylococcus marylandisciuri TaxID=2981529 RepID=A0ABT2QSQ4_9STAP|nr:TspO/MBR family protein [Staphylococcus marylandisciuri]MCU5746978.1 tryptophan-rich sensory protein [Staphylococcus marylandisciuri]
MNIIRRSVELFTPFIGGNIIGKVTAKEAPKDFEKFKSPPFSPPKIAFPIVWPILYLLMGISYVLVKVKGEDHKAETVAHYTQLSLNFAWSLLYFKVKARRFALVDSFLLFIAVVMSTIIFFNKRPLAGMLLLPYVVWSLYASYLTTGNYLLNKENPEYMGRA